VLAAARGDLAGAAGALRKALSSPTPTPDAQAVERVVTSCREATNGAGESPGLATVLRVLTEDRALPEPLRRELRAARFASIRAASRRTSLAPQAALVIEFDADAFPQGSASAEASHLLGTALPAMRDELKAATGVRTPRVVVRTSELLGSGCYRLLVRGVPYAGGRHATGRFMCVDPAAPDELASDEPPLASVWDGTRGHWLTGRALGDARRRGLRLLEPLDAVVWHLSGLVRVHLPSLVGLTDVRHALGVLLAGGHQDGIDIAGVMGDVGRQVQLAAVVRQLVREQVGVGDLATIVAAIEDAPAGEDVLACVDRARAALPLALPGAGGARARLTLDPELEAAIAAADPAVEHPRLCLACSELVAGRTPGSFVISVHERERRRAVQRAFDRLLPTVAVVAARDLPAARVQGRRGRQRATVKTGA
jgi:flagellar biosynthesis component FlhA